MNDSREKKFTNEHLRQKFKNQFEMVNCAIHRAEEIIRRGEQPHLSYESQNVALHVIELINDEEDIETGGAYFATKDPIVGSNGIENEDWDEHVVETPPPKKSKK